LPAPFVPGPARSVEDRLPVAGRRTVRLRFGPDVPVGLGIVAAGPALGEPGMLVRSMAVDLIDQHLEPELVSAGEHPVEIGERPEDRIDIAIVGDVVAEILHRRGEEWREPDRVYAEGGDVLQPFGDAGQVADPVAVRIREAARVDLVDDRAFPPWIGLGRRGRHGIQNLLLSADHRAASDLQTRYSSGASSTR